LAVNEREFGRKLKERLDSARFRGSFRGRIGFEQSDGSVQLTTSDLRANEVWVTFHDDPRQVVAALCLKVKKEINMPVIVQTNIDGRWEIVGIDNEPAMQTFGEAAPTLNVPDRIGELVKEIVLDKNIQPGRVRASGNGDMLVWIEPFFVHDFYWTGGLFDLTSYRPATANTQAWVVVGVNATDGTGYAVTGTEYSLAFTMNASQMVDNAIAQGVIPLWGWVLFNGQTSITPATQNTPYRYWFSPVGTVFTIQTNLTEVGNIGAGEDDLMSYTVPANTLSTNRQYIHFSAAGIFAATANNKRIRVRFGTALLYDTGALVTTTAENWSIEGWIIREAAAVQKCIIKFVSSDAALVADADYVGATEDLTAALALRLTGEATANNDIVEEMSIVERGG